ncbi:cell wall-active antibiotics response protein LiaF [uncultured Brevibacillus sp.]|uniref:cell wall-active antibiotics response protein LiaF n=1 Tax=uncultured Brevibacillus sp. TaxID=169970 RepID=UPI002596E1CE|nr:cell wall-active antibiotics response protein LiaF [uncultured Brevibacillus sp.]
MKLSRLHKMLAGVLIILTGIGLLLNGLHIITFGLFDLWPMLLVYFGARLWKQNNRIGGGILISLGTIIALEMWFSIGIDDLFRLAVPFVFIYFGFRLVRGRTRQKGPLPKRDTVLAKEDLDFQPESMPGDEGIADESKGQSESWTKWRPPGAKAADKDGSTVHRDRMLPKDSRSSLIGDFHLTSGRFELSQLHVWHGIGDVVIDLSRAMLMKEEALLIVEGWVGDVTIYVPVDLPVLVSAELTVGDLEVFSHRQGGVNRSLMIRSDHYDQAVHKVNLHISLLVGDIKVKYI